jgi:phosphohistidine phosphatase
VGVTDIRDKGKQSRGTMKYRPWWFYIQSGVVPYRMMSGKIEILLITSRRHSRWMIPKGVVEPGASATESACREAFEEAGVRGNSSVSPVGAYQYDKWGGTCNVTVFALAVEKVLDRWPESHQRQRKWMQLEAAADAVKEPQLKRIIMEMEEMAHNMEAMNYSNP